jgi:hypothetical protein
MFLFHATHLTHYFVFIKLACPESSESVRQNWISWTLPELEVRGGKDRAKAIPQSIFNVLTHISQAQSAGITSS